MSVGTKQRGHRRERRKAKASAWARQPRRKFGVHAHGETGDATWRLPGRSRLNLLRKDSIRNRYRRRAGLLSNVLSEPLGAFFSWP